MKKFSFLCLSLFVALASMADDWTLVTNASDLQAGDVIVLAYTSEGVTAGTDVKTGKGIKYLQPVDAAFGNDVISSLDEKAAQLTLGGSAGAWTLTNQEGKQLGVTSVKNIAWGSGTMTWKISIAGGDATISSTNDNCGILLYNIQNPRFTTYSQTSNPTKLIQIYRGKATQKHTLTYKDYPYKKTACDLPVYAAGHKVTLSSGKPKKAGNVFKGWKYADQTYQPGATFTMPDADAELVAIWEEGEETLSNDVAIKELKISGAVVTAIQDVYSYEFTVEIPAAEVTYVLNDANASGTPKTGFAMNVPAAGAEAVSQVITVVAEDGVTKKEYTVRVSVASSQGIEDVEIKEDVRKVLMDGQLYIIRGNAMYNMMGGRVK